MFASPLSLLYFCQVHLLPPADCAFFKYTFRKFGYKMMHGFNNTVLSCVFSDCFLLLSRHLQVRRSLAFSGVDKSSNFLLIVSVSISFDNRPLGSGRGILKVAFLQDLKYLYNAMFHIVAKIYVIHEKCETFSGDAWTTNIIWYMNYLYS